MLSLKKAIVLLISLLSLLNCTKTMANTAETVSIMESGSDGAANFNQKNKEDHEILIISEASNNSQFIFSKEDSEFYSVDRCDAVKSKKDQRWYCVIYAYKSLFDETGKYFTPKKYVNEIYSGELISYIIIPSHLNKYTNEDKGVIIFKYKINEKFLK